MKPNLVKLRRQLQLVENALRAEILELKNQLQQLKEEKEKRVELESRVFALEQKINEVISKQNGITNLINGFIDATVKMANEFEALKSYVGLDPDKFLHPDNIAAEEAELQKAKEIEEQIEITPLPQIDLT